MGCGHSYLQRKIVNSIMIVATNSVIEIELFFRQVEKQILDKGGGNTGPEVVESFTKLDITTKQEQMKQD